MKIDLHTHSTSGSPCSMQTVEELVEQAVDCLDAVCLTDHGSTAGAERALRISKQKDFPVFIGVEAWCNEGHFLVFSAGRLPTGGPFSLQEVAAIVQADEHVIIPAHTYRNGWGEDTAEIVRRNRDLFAAIEVYNGNCGKFDIINNLHLADELGLPGVGCSDSHGVGTVGIYYTEFEDEITSVEELIRAIKAGRCKPAGWSL